MGEPKQIETLVQQAVSEALNELVPGWHEQVVQRVLEQVRHELAEEELPSPDGSTSTLNEALAAIQAATTQVQILDAMVDGATRFAARTVLYVVRGANAVGWRAKGFADDDAVRTQRLELTTGLPAAALASHTNMTGTADEFMQGFSEHFGAPIEPCLICPLVVRDKVVALIYADGGTGGEHRMDRPALEVLVRTTGLWLEVFATRKASHLSTPQPAAMAAAAAATAPASPAPVPSEKVAEPHPAPAPVVETTQDKEIHRKAKRFAKLLVDEIKLYNQAKVSEGRQHRDLYDRLRDDIEKSRESYDKRYGNTAAKDGDYFNQELIRILADNDVSLFGENFPR